MEGVCQLLIRSGRWQYLVVNNDRDVIVAEIDNTTPLPPVIPHRPSRKVDEEERARDERQRRQQQEKYIPKPKPENIRPKRDDDDRPRIDEYV